jgi:heptaprenyl diphosphate synthase
VDLTLLASLLAVPELPRRLELVETRLLTTLTVDVATLEGASRRVTRAGGKRLRPAFVVTCAALDGCFDDRVVSAATAVELVQVGSLVHDDIFENAHARRSVETINHLEGPKVALLAGDFLLARAGVEAAIAGTRVGEEIAATVATLCRGQSGEMRYGFDVDRPRVAYDDSIGAKTASLFSCSCRVGALCAGLSDDEVYALGRFGWQFGMAFQVLDDVLDVIGDPVLLGKGVGTDLATGVYTLPVLLALDRPDGGDLRATLARRDYDSVGIALRTLRRGPSIGDALDVARQCARDAAHEILTVRRAGAAELAEFPEYYVEWALEAFTAEQEG